MPSSPKNREPQWPRERVLDRYNALAGFEIQHHLRDGGLWIEIGVGKGALPMRPLIGKPGVTLKAIAPHQRALPAGISLTSGCVPDHVDFLSENRGRARLVTDIFGSVSYCEDPVQALIYGALLLSRDGVFVAVTMLHRLDDLDTLHRISSFFHHRLHQAITFQTMFVLSDASGEFSTYLRIRIEGGAKRRAALPTILKDARRAIGRPRQDVPLWISKDKSARIWRVCYTS